MSIVNTINSTFMKKVFIWLESLFVLCILLIVYCKGIDKVQFHPDESHWIYSSTYFDSLIQGDFSRETWQESVWTLTQPPIIRYFIGLGRLLLEDEIDIPYSPWDFFQDSETNIALGNMPEPRILWWSRFPMAVLAALSGFLLFSFLREGFNRIAGYTVLMLFLFNDYYLLILRRAMGEASLLFFTFFALVFTYFAVKYWRQVEHNLNGSGSVLLMFLMAGVSSGFAGASKINGLLPVIPLAVICFLMPLVRKSRLSKEKRLSFGIRTSILVSLTTLLIFILVNPYLYSDPVQRTARIIKFRIEDMQKQYEEYPEAQIDSMSSRIDIVPHKIFVDFSTLQFPASIYFNIFFSIIGFLYMSVMSIKWWQNRVNSHASMVFLFLISPLVIGALFTPLNWDRYYLFAEILAMVCFSIGIAWLIKRIFIFIQSNCFKHFKRLDSLFIHNIN